MIYREYIEPVNDGHEVRVAASARAELEANWFAARGGCLDIESIFDGTFEARAWRGGRAIVSCRLPSLAKAQAALAGVVELAVKLTREQL